MLAVVGIQVLVLWAVLGGAALPESQQQSLLRLEKLLGNPSALGGWNSNTSFCAILPSRSLNLFCSSPDQSGGQSLVVLLPISVEQKASANYIESDFLIACSTRVHHCFFNTRSIEFFPCVLDYVEFGSRQIFPLFSTLIFIICLFYFFFLFSSCFFFSLRFSPCVFFECSTLFLPYEFSLSRKSSIDLLFLIPDPAMSIAIPGPPARRLLRDDPGQHAPLLPRHPSPVAHLAGHLGPPPAQQILNLSSNFLSGSIPDSRYSSLGSLQSLALDNNILRDTFPAALNLLPNLDTLDLSHNQIAGTLPAQISLFPALKTLILDDNLFFGALPDSLANARTLQTLSISDFLAGIVPNLSRIATLRALDLAGNHLGLSFPPLAPGLAIARLDRNRIAAAIPDNLQRSGSELRVLNLSLNAITGSAPAWIFALPQLQFLAATPNLCRKEKYFPARLRSITYTG